MPRDSLQYRNRKLAIAALAPVAKAECMRLMGLLHAAGYDQKFGEEFEFTLEPPLDSAVVERKRLEAIAKLEADAAKPDAPKKEIARKVERVKKFSPQEIFMFDLIELDPSLAGKLEYKFGAEQYYDNPGVLEIQSKPESFERFHADHDQVMEALKAKVSEYSAVHYKFRSSHLHKSTWLSGENINSDKHPRYLEYTGREEEGLASVFYHALPLIINPEDASIPLVTGVANSRDCPLRVCKDSIELRLNEMTPYFSDLDTRMMLMLAGTYSAFVLPNEKKARAMTVPYRIIDKVTFAGTYTEPAVGKLRHLLSGAILCADKSFELPQSYFSSVFIHIAGKLGITPEVPLDTAISLQTSANHLMDRLPASPTEAFVKQQTEEIWFKTYATLMNLRLTQKGGKYVFDIKPGLHGEEKAAANKAKLALAKIVEVEKVMPVPIVPKEFLFELPGRSFQSAQHTVRFEDSHLKEILLPETMQAYGNYFRRECGVPSTADRETVSAIRDQMRRAQLGNRIGQ